MILTPEEAKTRMDCHGMTDTEMECRLEAIESVIRAYTANRFQIRPIRFRAASREGILMGCHPAMLPGDTVEISQSGGNDGIYTVTENDGETLRLSSALLDGAQNVVTAVRYPPAVKQCAADLLKWAILRGDKIGVKSESIGRHSVTYEGGEEMYMGYPAGILEGLKLYRKARC